MTPSPTVERLLDSIEDALASGQPDRAASLAREAVSLQPELPDTHFLLAEAHRELGEFELAEDAYLRAAQLDATYSDAWSGLGTVLFDMLRFDESGPAISRSIREDEGNAEGYWGRGLLRERREDYSGAERDFLRAHRLAPDRYPHPVVLEDADVNAVVGAAISQLHPTLQSFLMQVPILLEEVPDAQTCLALDPPGLPSELLGLFRGGSLDQRSMHEPWSNLPSSIVLYRRNLARLSSDPHRVIEELRTTVFHEIGHFLGLDEDDLTCRGLD